MSVIYCHDCDRHIDTDFDVDHLDECPNPGATVDEDRDDR